MLVKRFVMSFGGAARLPLVQGLALWIAACAHCLVAPSFDRTIARDTGERRHAGSVRARALKPLCRTGKRVARAALRLAYAGNPLTPTGYAILALTVAAIALVAMLSTSPVAGELRSALRLSWWFS